jgi:hypothetical protein
MYFICVLYHGENPYTTLLVKCDFLYVTQNFFSLDDIWCNFFALYNTLVHYMTYKDVIAPNTTR